MLDFYKKLNDTVLPPGWLGHGYLDTFTNLATGKVAMVYQGHGRSAGYIEKYAPKGTGDPEYFGVMRKPHGPSGKQTAAQVDAEPWMIFKNSKYPEEAAEFLKFFFQEKNYIKYLHTVPVHLLPTLKSTRNSPAYQANEMYQRWKEWVDMDYYYFERDLAKPTLVVNWDDSEAALPAGDLRVEHPSRHGDRCGEGDAVGPGGGQGPGPGRGTDHQARLQAVVSRCQR